MSLELSQEVESVIRERAAAEGVTANELLARAFALEKTGAVTLDDPNARVQALLTKWQAEDNTPLLRAVSTRSGETPTQALFRQWSEEGGRRTDAEREAEERLWAEIEQGLRENSGTLRLRTLR